MSLLEELGLKIEDVVTIDPSPTNVANVNLLLSTCVLDTSIASLVATLPFSGHI